MKLHESRREKGMSNKYVIGLDYGTKSERAVLVDTSDGKILSVSEMMYPHGVMEHFLPDRKTELGVDWCLQDPSDYLLALEKTIHGVLANSGVSPSDIIGLSIDFTASTVLPVTKDGTPLCCLEKFAHRPHAYVKLWKHHAAQKQADHINDVLSKRGELNLPRYGGKISPELMLPKALQILDEDEEIYKTMDSFLEAPDWINFLLTGERKRSASTAGYKAMYFNEEGYPKKDFFREIDPRMENFIEEKCSGNISPMGSCFGTLKKEWAEKLGLAEGTAVGTSIIDAHAGLPGCGITAPGKMMLILGTSSVQAVLSDHPYSGNGIMGAVKGGIIPGYYALESGLAAVGDQLDWFVSRNVPASYRERAEREGKNIHSLLSELGEKLPAGGNGLLALDWWSGNKTPYVDGELSGMIVGLNMTTSPEEIYRALIESSAYGTREITDYFEATGVKVDEIIACGGIVGKNPFLMQVFADVTGKTIRASEGKQTAATGAAVYAAVAAGKKAGGYDTISDAVSSMIKSADRIYTPVPASAAVYESLYKSYLALTGYFNPAQNPVMKQLKEFRRSKS